MSDNWFILIPTDPEYVPSPAAQQAALERFQALVSPNAEVTMRTMDSIEFVDQGVNFVSVSCPLCGTSLTDWWLTTMEPLFEEHGPGISNLMISAPCCRDPISLNNLNYNWPAGFARFALEALYPDISNVPDDAVVELQQILGCSLRIIWAHY